MIGKAELPLEGARGDALIKVFALAVLGLAAFDRHRVLFGSDGNLVSREAGDGERNLIAVFAQPLDVVGRVVILAGALRGFNEVEKAVEADGRTPEGCEVVCAHSQILQRASWIRAAPDTTGARLKAEPIRRPDRRTAAAKKLENRDLVSRVP